ncbi:MAG: PAS domain-containing protein [Alphaproteobacteria bacterium]|jgi:PAS domain S-box-containing protein|nr:PAS domain-containing protein [Alphaproteobacteria bacterium]
MAGGVDLVQFASDPAFAIDEDTCVVGWNDGAENLLGYSADEAIGRHCYEVLEAVFASGELLCTPFCEGAACFKGSRPFAVPACRLRCKDGRWVTATIASLVMPRGADGRLADQAVTIVFVRENAAVATCSSGPAFSFPWHSMPGTAPMVNMA